ncbi:lipolytic protein G-D-S-L family [Pirellula staleyi DSM 6068]|uniref:Lipolytic protein G-D-S-L family n=1 Tax=Pirellula staleyi (strain ATCC 27377 / DSM 6068 / ICPB 4128) TaxID=530564 RepID=D2R5J9_PIRSD|nr:GDSL-type esterase/lipase family protein [Pirellula staleyi]ADB17181.1 lipolytic protein G-D-S-L family [Pirellula staleyi DSM 6068]
MKVRPFVTGVGLLLVVFAAIENHASFGAEVSGAIENPGEQFSPAADFQLTADTTFGWRTGRLSGAINLAGHTLTIDTGGGNRTTLDGAISGAGNLVWIGGGAPTLQTAPSFLGGESPSSFTGTLTITQGTLALAKPMNVAAFAGKLLVLGGGKNQAIVRLDQSEQLPDDCVVRMLGEHEARIWTSGNSETLGPLDLQTHGTLDLGEGDSSLCFADSSAVRWDLSKTLTIEQWTTGRDKVAFGTSATGLTDQQLARIGFANPSQHPPGLYSAKIGSDGAVVPGVKIAAKNAPFDLSENARAEREKLYAVQGLAHIAAADSPLQQGMSLSFFGDSITWQDVYLAKIRAAIAAGETTRKLEIKCINRGINGGGVLAVRDGSEKAAYVSEAERDGRQAALAEVIAADKSSVAVVFIGINDVWWRDTTPEVFETTLRDIAATCRQNRTKLVLATLAIYQEKPDGTNPLDKKCDAFAELTRTVAKAEKVTLVDLRSAMIAYLQNHNAQLRVDGMVVSRESGLLTYDGVHPSEEGNRLLAELISDGVVRALRSE